MHMELDKAWKCLFCSTEVLAWLKISSNSTSTSQNETSEMLHLH